MNTIISNDIISLRAVEPTDLPTLYSWENDVALWSVTSTMAPYSKHVLQQYIDNYVCDIYAQRQLRLMITLNRTDEAIGALDFIDFSPLDNRAEVGIVIDSKFRRQSIEIAKRYARNHIGMRQLYAIVRTDNVAGLNTFLHHGFTASGTLKNWVRRGLQYHDAVILQCVL